MKYDGELNLEQIEAIVNKLGGMEGIQRFLRDEIIVSESSKLTELSFHEETTVGPLTKRFVPNEFFTAQQGLYLWNDMQRVLKNAQAVDPVKTEATKLRSFDLTKNAYDKKIKAELSGNCEVELWQIAELIEAQKNGEDGSLLTNGYANIFYVADFAVGVHWGADDREWNVAGWRLVGGRWRAGSRVFSRK